MYENIGIYAIRDRKAEKFDVPFFAANDLFAERKFTLMVKDKGSIVNQWKNEFELKRLGWLNVMTGEIQVDNHIVIEGVQIDTKEEN